MSVTMDRLSARQRPARPRQPVPARRVSPSGALFAIAFGAVLVIALWWRDNPAISGLSGWLTGAGRITGLLAGYAVVVLIALMARIPLLERGIGSDRLARWHAMGGRYTVGLVAAHGLLITLGYAATTRTDPIRQFVTLLMSYPDVLAATVAGLLLVGVGIVSARAARARMRYETWYYLHFYTYLAVALAFAHQFATGADFRTNLAARVVWSAMYLTVGVLLLWFRFLTPIRLAARHALRVASVRAEGPDTVSIYLTGRHLTELAAEPGQFFRWRFLTRHGWWSANPYSLSAPPRPDRLRITAKRAGDHSASLADLRPGTRVLAEGPYGAFTAERRTRRKVLLLAGGVGITPLRPLFETIPAAPGDLTLIYRASTSRELLFRRELELIAEDRGARLHYLLGSRARLGYEPLSAATLRSLVPDVGRHDVYLCGPPGMTDAAKRALRRAGVPRRHIHHESFEF